MQRWTRFGTALICGIALLAVVLWWHVRLAFPDDMCGNTLVAELPSPTGALKAVVFERDCGATTDFSTQVSVLRADELLTNVSGNLFIADSDHGKAPAGPRGGPEVRVIWMDEHKLRIEHHSGARVFLAKRGTHGLAVRYATFD